MEILKRTCFCLIVAALTAAGFNGCSAEAKKSRLLKSAERYFESGDFDKAKVEYLNILKEDPQNATAIQRLATIWLEQGSPLQAARFLLAARELTPENLDARAKLVSVFIYAGQFKEARQEVLAVLDQSPLHEEALRLLVETSFKKEDLDDAERRLRSLDADDKPGFHLAKAALFFRKGDLAAAEAEAMRTFSLDPNSVEAHLALAKVYLSKKDLVGADDELKTAAQLAPLRSPARLAYAEFKLRNGAIDEAANLLHEITRQAPDSLIAWRLLAQIAFAQKKLDESLKLLDNIIFRDPANIEARQLQAQVWLAQGEVKKAIESLESLDTSYPQVLPIKYQLARAYLQDKNAIQAASVLNQVLAQNPNYTEARLLLSEINLRNGKAQQVMTSMVDLLKEQPGLAPAQVLLAQAYQSLGRLEDAAAIFREQIRSSPQNSQPYLLLGLILRQQDKIDEARKVFEDAYRFTPEKLLAVDQLVELDIRSKNFDAALQRIQADLQKTPQSPAAHLLEGKVYAAQGQWDRAEAALLKTLELDPNSSSAYDLLIATYVASNKLAQATTHLESLLSKNPNNVPALMLSALIYERMHEFSKATATYEKLLLAKPDFPLVLNNLAYLYAERLDKHDKAYELARKARALEPGNAAIADTLGWILYKRGDYKQAVALLTESAKNLPNNPEIQFHLGMASYMMGKMDEAREAFLRATASVNDFAGKDEARRRLSMLQVTDGNTAELTSSDLQAILKQQPDDPLFQVLLGESYEKKGAFVEAASAYEQALKLNPRLLSATARLAQLNAGPLQASDKALEFAKKARELAPNDPKIISILGDAAYQTGNFKWAYSLLQESARQIPADPKILHDLAWAAYSLGKVNEAQQSMRSILTTAPDSLQSNDAKLFLQMVAFDPKGATSKATEANIEKLLKTNPSYVPALMAQAAVLESRSESNGAAKIYTDVLNRFPDFAPAQKRLASLYQGAIEKRDEAYDLAVRARKTLPEDPELAQMLAKLSYERNEFAYAAELLKQSAEIRPLGAEDLYYLGMSQFKSREPAEAREALDQALAAGLNDPLASDARRTIEKLDQDN